MIPYAIFMFSLTWPDGACLQCGALELRPTLLRFRCAPDWAERLAAPPPQAEVCFWRESERKYDTLTLRAFSLHACPDTDAGIPGAQVWELHTRDADFALRAARLLTAYGNYIRTRLETDEDDLAEALTGRAAPLGDAEALTNWKLRQTAPKSDWHQPLQPCSLALSLDLPSLQRDFLALPFAAFKDAYWARCALRGHPVSEVRVTHICIGSQFCPLLCPAPDMLRALADRCLALGLIPVVCPGPLGERHLDAAAEKLRALDRWCASHGTRAELVLSDLGAPLLVRQLSDNGEIDARHFDLTAGILLSMHAKDPRSGWPCTPHPYAASADQTVLRDRFGFTRFAYDGPPETLPPQMPDGILHLPLYQTATAPLCTLAAACETGARGKQSARTDCSCPCETHYFQYPAALGMAGLGNSLFGCDMRVLNDSEELNGLLARGIRRLVIRL